MLNKAVPLTLQFGKETEPQRPWLSRTNYGKPRMNLGTVSLSTGVFFLCMGRRELIRKYNSLLSVLIFPSCLHEKKKIKNVETVRKPLQLVSQFSQCSEPKLQIFIPGSVVTSSQACHLLACPVTKIEIIKWSSGVMRCTCFRLLQYLYKNYKERPNIVVLQSFQCTKRYAQELHAKFKKKKKKNKKNDITIS